jgi:hypothetical protein
MELWKNHHAYILRRFVVIEVMEAIVAMITPDNFRSSRSALVLSGLAYKDGHVIRLTFLSGKVP